MLKIEKTSVVNLMKAGGQNVLLGAFTGIGMVAGYTIAAVIAERIVDPEGSAAKKAQRKANRAAKKAAKLAKKAAKVNPEKPDETMAEFEVSEEGTEE